jgi:pimeloyl-ACP methyl ester carboxylesterase
MSAPLSENIASPPAAAVELNCVRIGAGDALVLIHGLGANLSFWFFGPAPLLAPRHQLIMYDLRGHGRSLMPRSGYGLSAMAGDLLGLLDRLGVTQADIVGHSFGGRVALTFAVEYPERVRNLVVADTPLRALQAPVRLREWSHWPRWKAELQAQGLEDPPSDAAVIDYRLLAELGRYGHVPTAGIAASRGIALRSRQPGAKAAQRWQELLQHTTAPQEIEDESPLDRRSLAAIAAPTLLMFGERTHCLPTAYGLLELLPNARLMLIPGAGHFFPVVKPLYFARGLSSFLSRSEAGIGGLRSARARRLAARARERAPA